MSLFFEYMYLIILILIMIGLLIYGLIGKRKKSIIAVKDGQIPGRYNDYLKLDQINGGLMEVEISDPRSVSKLYNYDIKESNGIPYINKVPLSGTGLDKLTPVDVPKSNCYYPDQIIAMKKMFVCTGSSGCYPNYAFGESIYNYVEDTKAKPCINGNDNFGFITIAGKNLSVSGNNVILTEPSATDPNQYWSVNRFNKDGTPGDGPILTIKSRNLQSYLDISGNKLILGSTGDKLWALSPEYNYNISSDDPVTTLEEFKAILNASNPFVSTHKHIINVVTPQQLVYASSFDVNNLSNYFPQVDIDKKKYNGMPVGTDGVKAIQPDGSIGIYSLSTSLVNNSSDFVDFILYTEKLKSNTLFKYKKNGVDTKDNSANLGGGIFRPKGANGNSKNNHWSYERQ